MACDIIGARLGGIEGNGGVEKAAEDRAIKEAVNKPLTVKVFLFVK
jgi:hypothetical protein